MSFVAFTTYRLGLRSIAVSSIIGCTRNDVLQVLHVSTKSVLEH